MKKILCLLTIIMMFIAVTSYAQEYNSNTWASWASVTGTQIDWVFPYNSRQVVLMNGSSIPVCVSFGRSATIANGCTDSANDVFQLGANQFVVMQNLVRPEIHLKSSSTAASPVSVIVAY